MAENVSKENNKVSDDFDFNKFVESENSIFLGGFFLGLASMYYFGLIGVIVAVGISYAVQFLRISNKNKLIILVLAAIIIGVFGQYLVNQITGLYF